MAGMSKTNRILLPIGTIIEIDTPEDMTSTIIKPAHKVKYRVVDHRLCARYDNDPVGETREVIELVSE